MLNSKLKLTKIIKFLSISSICVGTLGNNAAYCSALEEFGDEHFRFIQSAIQARQKIIEISYENIAQKGSCGFKSQGFNLVSTFHQEGHRILECKTWTMNDIMAPLKEGSSDLALAFDSSKGFFVVTNTPENPLKGLAYTRAGDFQYDREGNLLNSAGYYLMGWKVDENGEIPCGANISVIDSLEIINGTSLSGTYKPTKTLIMQVNLPASAMTGDTHPVHTVVTDNLAINHNVLFTYTKAPNPLKWDLTITSMDTVDGGILQSSGINSGMPYNNMTIQFDTCGKVLSYNGLYVDYTPPTVSINWETTHAAPSLVTLNFGEIGANDAIRIMGDRALTVKNDSDGRGFSTVDGSYISVEGDVYSVFRNNDKLKTHKIAVARFNAPNFLERSLGNVFHETEESGNYILGRAHEFGNPRIMAGLLEDSSVNIISEFMTIKQAHNEIQVLIKSLNR